MIFTTTSTQRLRLTRVMSRLNTKKESKTQQIIDLTDQCYESSQHKYCIGTNAHCSTHRKHVSKNSTSLNIRNKNQRSLINSHALSRSQSLTSTTNEQNYGVNNSNYMSALNPNEHIEAYSSSNDVRIRIMKTEINLNVTRHMSQEQLTTYLITMRVDLLIISKRWNNSMYYHTDPYGAYFYIFLYQQYKRFIEKASEEHSIRPLHLRITEHREIFLQWINKLKTYCVNDSYSYRNFTEVHEHFTTHPATEHLPQRLWYDYANIHELQLPFPLTVWTKLQLNDTYVSMIYNNIYGIYYFMITGHAVNYERAIKLNKQNSDIILNNDHNYCLPANSSFRTVFSQQSSTWHVRLHRCQHQMSTPLHHDQHTPCSM